MRAGGHIASLWDSGMKPCRFLVLCLAILMGVKGNDSQGEHVTCDPNVHIVGGTLTKSNGNEVNSILKFECPDTQYPFPVAKAKCSRSGNWFRSFHRNITPTCKAFRCPVPVLEDGMFLPVNTSYGIGETITFECYDGYELHGSVSRTCMKNGRWNGTTTVCNSGSQHCPHPGIPPGGRKIGTSYGIGDKVEYACNGGLVLVGSSKRECLESKEWTGSQPNCQHKNSFDSPEEVAAAFTASFTNMLGMTRTRNAKNSGTTARKITLSKDAPLHVYILLDASESVGEGYFNQAKKVAENLIDKIASFDVWPRFGVISYASEPIVIASIYDDSESSADDAINLLRESEKATYEIHGDGRGTNIYAALRKVFEIMVLTKVRFQSSWDKIRFVTILFTDGKANMGGNPKLAVQDIKNFVQKQNKSDDYLDMYAFGVSADIDKVELNELASQKPDETHVFMIRNTLELVKSFDAILDFATIGDLCGVADETPDAAFEKRYPWHIKVEMLGTGKCSGSIVSPSWVLTAAHCLTDGKNEVDVSKIMVHVGAKNSQFKVKQKHLHPKFDLGAMLSENINQFYDYDVALLELTKRIDFQNTGSRSVCLPCTRETTRAIRRKFPGTSCMDHELEMLPRPGPVPADFVTHEGSTQLLAQVTIKTSEGQRKACEANALRAPEYKNVSRVDQVVTERFLCTGGLEPVVERVSCKGDSGGALFIHKKRRYIQVGVLSWGVINVCEDVAVNNKHARDFHINLFKVLPWLKEKVGQIITFII
uniref:C3/C5 convertase n=1 Tax=Sphyrna zygaena TaxID=195335 RepID=A0A146GEH6_SPHZY|nr:C2fB1 [Sphyrna zygaena]